MRAGVARAGGPDAIGKLWRSSGYQGGDEESGMGPD